MRSLRAEEEHLLPDASAGKMVSLESERGAFARAYAELEVVLKHAPTTIEQDEHLLLDPTLSTNKKNAIILRKGQKVIFQNNMDLLKITFDGILRNTKKKLRSF